MFRGVALSSILALGVALAGCTGMVAGTSGQSGSSVAPGATIGTGDGSGANRAPAQLGRVRALALEPARARAARVRPLAS